MISKTEIDGQKMVIEELKRIKEGIKITAEFLEKCSNDNISMRAVGQKIKLVNISIDETIASINQNIEMFEAITQ